jgi:quercetin dioxygenase-like cupin family protein
LTSIDHNTNRSTDDHQQPIQHVDPLRHRHRPHHCQRGGGVDDDQRSGVDTTVDLADLSNVAVTRMTFQPGAQAPWHTHAGPVLVSVVEGELVYVMADCTQHSYAAGSAFVDPGRGNVHTGYNPTDGLTVLINTFLEAPADGPLLITEGIIAPADDCGLPAAIAGD